MDANTKENFRFTVHPDTTGVACSTPAWGVGREYTHNYSSFNAHLYVVVQPNHDLRPL
jgi:hypothetical protein